MTYLAHQTQKTELYQMHKMCQIFATLNSTLTSLAQYGHRMTYGLLFFYSSFSLIFPSVSSSFFFFLKCQSSPLSQPLFFVLSPSLLFHADADDHFHTDLSLAMVFLFCLYVYLFILFYFFVCGLMGGFRW